MEMIREGQIQTLNPAYKEIFASQQRKALALRNSTKKDRIAKLRKLKKWLQGNREELRQALMSDFQKPFAETDLSEYYIVKAEIDHAIKHLGDWMNPQRLGTPLPLIGSRASAVYEPKGVCLLIGPWNYPFSLMVAPLVVAIAAGNTVMMKPSEMAIGTSALIARMAKEVFSPEEVAIIEGGVEVSTELLSMPFDHIFFTGSPRVGKIVMQAAAKNLTSVTLELGGKSPNIIDETANLKDAAEKMVFNKFLNGGQTCIAPDYVLVHSSVHDKFLDLFSAKIKAAYDEHPEHLAGIINPKHFDHLSGLLSNAVEGDAKVVFGGQLDRDNLRISPTLLTDVNNGMTIMHEEIFGPILPIVKFDDLDQAIDMINSKPKPLALYLFSRKRRNIDKVLKNTSSGGVCINDGVIHFSNNYLPFGGVNHSGMGKSHGYHGFKSFSNEKGILRQRVGLTSLKILYPPYTKRVQKFIDLLLKWL